MEEAVVYFKQKKIYVVHAENRVKLYGFGNVKAVLSWFEAGTLFPSFTGVSYNQLVAGLRKHGEYRVYHSGDWWYIKEVNMVGQKIRSSKLLKSGG
jgi:hypothetical protein